MVTDEHNVARHVDFLIGVVPIVNLEWIQKLIRDTSERGHSREAVTDSIVRSMDDYINFITPSSPAPTSTSSGCRRWIPPTPSAPR